METEEILNITEDKMKIQMELKLNKMKKALFRDRAKKLMLTGVLAGVIAGVAITSGISSITLKKAEKKANRSISGSIQTQRKHFACFVPPMG